MQSLTQLCSAPNVAFSLPVGVISTEVTYVLGGLVFAWIVEEWVWDYAITVTLLHIVMTVAGKHTLARSNKPEHFNKNEMMVFHVCSDVRPALSRALVDSSW